MVNKSQDEQARNGRIDKPIFQGEQVYLIAPDPVQDAGLFAKWMRDSEYVRLMDTDPARLLSIDKYKEWLEKDLVEEQKNDEIFFLISTLHEDRKIGLIGLNGIRWVHGDAWVGIGLGERDYWGKGYVTDAMLVLQRYAFEELNLHRLSLTVFVTTSAQFAHMEKQVSLWKDVLASISTVKGSATIWFLWVSCEKNGEKGKD